jgi:uncharacterized surface protein with fasciclin (FAS1) repeats
MKKLTLMLFMTLAFSVFPAHAQGDSMFVRVAHLAYDVGEVDLLVDGQVAFSARFGTVTRYFEGSAGTYQLAIVPTGAGIDAAVLGPADVLLEAGHSYTLAAVGQQADLSLSPLFIDETLTLQNSGLSTASPILMLHAVSGGSAVDVYNGSEVIASQLGFGGYVAAAAPLGQFELRATPAGQPDATTLTQTSIGVPNNLLFLAVAGIADDYIVVTANASSLNAVDFLTGLSGTPLSVDTLLTAASAAGLNDALANQGPFTLFAPLDSAFAATSVDLADAAGLTNLLGYHIVPSYVSSAEIVDDLIANGSVTLTAVQTEALTISNTDGRVLVNGTAQLVAVDYYVRNGVVHFIDAVLNP